MPRVLLPVALHFHYGNVESRPGNVVSPLAKKIDGLNNGNFKVKLGAILEAEFREYREYIYMSSALLKRVYNLDSFDELAFI